MVDPRGISSDWAFGKLTRNVEGRITGWLSLADHMTDVAACFEQLCACRNIHRALTTAAGRVLSGTDVARLAALAFLHDLGKANSGFQSKRWNPAERPKPWPLPAGHGAEAFLIFNEPALEQLYETLPFAAMEPWGEAVLHLLPASISHHGNPILSSPANASKTLWRPVLDSDGQTIYDPLAVLRAIAACLQVMLPTAFEAPETPLPESPAFGHLFAGLVQLADWLGSDTRHFPYSVAGEDRVVTARENAKRAVNRVGLDTSRWQHALQEKAPTFATAFGISRPHPIQEAIGNRELRPLVILESETGSGKTEAALWRYAQLFRAGLVDSLYFALPTRVSAKQVYDRVRAVAERLWPGAPPLTVRALPGYTAADGEEPQLLPGFEVLWSDTTDEQTAHRRWAAESPKRFLAAPIAVGTIDQALLGILKVRHAHLRYAMLARSLLVVDEVHASDAYMTVLLERLLRAHLGNGGQAVLLSATLGSSARTRFLAVAGATPQAPSLSEAKSLPYPSITDFERLRQVEGTGQTKAVSWSLHDCIGDAARIAEMVVDAAGQAAKVLVIRNTVATAIEVFREVIRRVPDPGWMFSVNGVLTLHHSRFSRQDRPLLDQSIEGDLGRQRRPGRRIVIGTQTLEQSLDIDADLLITDICPMDVLLQRIGRLHRHQRPEGERPAPFRAAQVRVLVPEGRDFSPLIARPAHGLGRFRQGGGVYADLRIIAATCRLIEDRQLSAINIPQENRRLVEGATHPERLRALEDEMGSAWQDLGQLIEGDTGAKRTTAGLHALEVNKPFAADSDMVFPKEHKIATRLGAEDHLVEFDPPLPGPFGIPVRHLPISHHLWPKGLEADVTASDSQALEGRIEFSIGPVRYRYGSVGLERIDQQ